MKALLLSCVCFRPELLIMDEPFSGLDPKMRDEVTGGLLEMIGGSKPCTVILSSHDIFEVERLADHVGILIDGRLMVAEPISRLQERIRHIQVVDLTLNRGLLTSLPPTWEDTQMPSPTALHFIHRNFTPAVEAEIHARFPSANVEVSTLSLRDLFLLCTASAQTVETAIS
ncbi:MAG TPA: hypothetical protein PLN52_10315 [Opitutaceae bacterium]|nr:hypothetical protein [Opitutaceae bacterium]